MRKIVKQKRGAALIEYGILLGLISVTSLFSVDEVGKRVTGIFVDVTDEVADVGVVGKKDVPGTSTPTDNPTGTDPNTDPNGDPNGDPDNPRDALNPDTSTPKKDGETPTWDPQDESTWPDEATCQTITPSSDWVTASSFPGVTCFTLYGDPAHGQWFFLDELSYPVFLRVKAPIGGISDPWEENHIYIQKNGPDYLTGAAYDPTGHVDGNIVVVDPDASVKMNMFTPGDNVVMRNQSSRHFTFYKDGDEEQYTFVVLQEYCTEQKPKVMIKHAKTFFTDVTLTHSQMYAQSYEDYYNCIYGGGWGMEPQ